MMKVKVALFRIMNIVYQKVLAKIMNYHESQPFVGIFDLDTDTSIILTLE